MLLVNNPGYITPNLNLKSIWFGNFQYVSSEFLACPLFQDKSLKCTIYRLTGSIPAGNYIQIPKTKSQSLGLTGRYMYILFKAIPSKYFVVHIDVATQDNLIVRISFSNLFKEFKSTSTWLQFPFVCNPSRGSVHAFASMGSNGKSRQICISHIKIHQHRLLLYVYICNTNSVSKNDYRHQGVKLLRLCYKTMIRVAIIYYLINEKMYKYIYHLSFQ